MAWPKYCRISWWVNALADDLEGALQGQEAENPPFPWDELQEIGRKGLPSAGVEAAKTVLFSFVKYATFPVHHMLLIRVQPND